MGYKETIIWFNETFGLLEFLLPFMFIFTISYAIFKKTRILGEGRERFSFIAALVISMMVSAPAAYYGKIGIGKIMQVFVPVVTMLLLIFLLWILLIGALGMELDTKFFMTVFGILIAIKVILPDNLIIASVLGYELNLFPSWFYTREFLVTLIMFFAAACVVAYIIQEPKKKETAQEEDKGKEHNVQ